MWVQFAPSSHVADPESWQMYKLGQPVSPLDVVYNGSRSLHVVSDEGISVKGAGKASWEQLNIRSLPSCHALCWYQSLTYLFIKTLDLLWIACECCRQWQSLCTNCEMREC